jgi:hypothetical protein
VLTFRYSPALVVLLIRCTRSFLGCAPALSCSHALGVLLIGVYSGSGCTSAQGVLFLGVDSFFSCISALCAPAFCCAPAQSVLLLRLCSCSGYTPAQKVHGCGLAQCCCVSSGSVLWVIFMLCVHAPELSSYGLNSVMQLYFCEVVPLRKFFSLLNMSLLKLRL